MTPDTYFHGRPTGRIMGGGSCNFFRVSAATTGSGFFANFINQNLQHARVNARHPLLRYHLLSEFSDFWDSFFLLSSLSLSIFSSNSGEIILNHAVGNLHAFILHGAEKRGREITRNNSANG